MTLDISKYPTLALADTPEELRTLPRDHLPQLCEELRTYLLNTVSHSSGHFASGLGTVELTVALHYVYNTPFDHLVWDVGHQAYPHKILTGRREQMPTIREKRWPSPLPLARRKPLRCAVSWAFFDLNQRSTRDGYLRGKRRAEPARSQCDWRRRHHRGDGF